MIVRLRQSGGFSGISKIVEIDTDELPSVEERKIKNLMNLSKLPIDKNNRANKRMAKGAADYFSYDISFYENGIERQLQCNQLDVDAATKKLIDYLYKYNLPKNKTRKPRTF